MQTTFIGSGNLAWHLAPALDNLGYVVKEVYSRNSKNAAALTERLYQAEVKKDLDFSKSTSKLFVMAVSDDVIRELTQEMIFPEQAILVHTSGSQPLSALEFASTPNRGVLYPLQTFTRKRSVNFKNIPLFVEANNTFTEKQLMVLAKELSSKTRKINSDERKALHIAAVFASNFSNHMLTISQSIMEKHDLNFEWLKPIILETIQKSLELGPQEAQTGPALRGDLEVLDEHLAFLKKEKAVAKIYELVSQHIIDTHSEEE